MLDEPLNELMECHEQQDLSRDHARQLLPAANRHRPFRSSGHVLRARGPLSLELQVSRTEETYGIGRASTGVSVGRREG